MRRGLGFFRFQRLLAVITVSGLTAAAGQEAPPADHPAAARLWASFLGKYEEKSLNPLDPAVLDEKARSALIGIAGPRFASLKPDTAKSLPELAEVMAARDPSVSSFDRIEKTLATLLPLIDSYGSYNPAADVALLREALRQHSGIVHMTLDERPDGRVLCYPMDGGPADIAGVNAGAVLLAVDARPVNGKSLLSLRLAFVGPADSIVRVKVRQPQGMVEEFSIKRTDQPVANVAVAKSIGGVNVRIRRFNEGSATLLKQQLEAYPTPGNITLDLRGNTGGLRDEALRTASLFFPEGTILGKFTSREGVMEPRDGNGVLVDPVAIRILQDERTASAAEYLIATLKEGLPGKVTTFGTRTFGKSHTVSQIPLEGGGELTVTESLMSTPAGHSWDKTGLNPDQAAK